ncbi:RNA polymerase sigma factor [Nakamurella lactea]|uniref:RNA polymerase sigma factor n=1 Tax=Nakamurella lactea TaxID=459515 RepID=UPI0004262C97|nr:sigma-70 family RNA polymerase sigma factor [Nakamurella lactea]
MGATTDDERQLQPTADEDDRAAFAAVYRRHSSQVFTHFLQRGVVRADAEDLTAEVFAIAWRRRSVIEPHPTAGLLPWLLGTANNLIKDSRRSIIRARRALARVELPGDVPDIAEELAASAEDRARIRMLTDVLADLTTAEQEVIQFCVLRGLSANVVAGVTGEPAGTVRSRLSRALAKARTSYAALNSDDAPRRTRRSNP